MMQRIKAFIRRRKPRRSPKARLFVLSVIRYHLHYTLLAVERQAETFTVARYNIKRLLIRMSLAVLRAPPHAVLYTMLAEHHRSINSRLFFKSRQYTLYPPRNI